MGPPLAGPRYTILLPSFSGEEHLCITTQRTPALETTKKDNPLHVCPYSASEPVEMGVREENITEKTINKRIQNQIKSNCIY